MNTYERECRSTSYSKEARRDPYFMKLILKKKDAIKNQQIAELSQKKGRKIKVWGTKGVNSPSKGNLMDLFVTSSNFRIHKGNLFQKNCYR